MISYLYFIITVLILFTSGIFLSILIYHFKDLIYNKKFEKKKENWEKIFFEFLNDEITLNDAAERFTRDYNYLYDFFKPYLKNLKGNDFARIRSLIRELEMDEYYLKKLKKGSRKKKVKAAVFLGIIGEEKAITYFKEYIYEDDDLIRRSSLWAIAEIGNTDFYLDVLKVVLNRTSMTFEALTELSIRFGREICFIIKELIEKYFSGEINFKEEFNVEDYMLLSLFIDILGYFRFIESLDLIKQILKDNENHNDEVYIHVFKALVRIDLPIDINLNRFLNHQNWVIRSQVARYIGKVKTKKYESELLKLLKDKNWWVRYYAAEALFKIDKVDLLKKISNLGKDGSEISHYVLDLHS